MENVLKMGEMLRGYVRDVFVKLLHLVLFYCKRMLSMLKKLLRMRKNGYMMIRRTMLGKTIIIGDIIMMD